MITYRVTVGKMVWVVEVPIGESLREVLSEMGVTKYEVIT